MTNFRYLECENWELITEKLYSYVKHETNLLEKCEFWNHEPNPNKVLDYVPELRDYFASLELIPSQFAFIILKDADTSTVHLDYLAPTSRIQWPIINCAGSTTKLYKFTKGKPILRKSGNVVYWDLMYTRYEEIDQFELKQPVVWRTELPHCVFTASKDIRISMTCYFTQPPDHLLK